jgi:N-acetylated-alpha-linked acidic dipeptidase
LYDDFHWMSTFADPTFVWLRSMAGVWGSVALRLADSDILPLSYVEYVRYMTTTMQTLQTLDKTNSYAAAFTSIFTSLQALTATANELDSLVLDTNVQSSLTDGSARAAIQLRQLNDQLFLSERCLMFWQGIPGNFFIAHHRSLRDAMVNYFHVISHVPSVLAVFWFSGREWYRHVVWVDDLYDGYGSVAFAAVNDALNDGSDASQSLAMANLVLDNLNQCLAPPAWLTQLKTQGRSVAAGGRSNTQMAGHPTAPELLDRFYDLPARHLKPQDKSRKPNKRVR